MKTINDLKNEATQKENEFWEAENEGDKRRAREVAEEIAQISYQTEMANRA